MSAFSLRCVLILGQITVFCYVILHKFLTISKHDKCDTPEKLFGLFVLGSVYVFALFGVPVNGRNVRFGGAGRQVAWLKIDTGAFKEPFVSECVQKYVSAPHSNPQRGKWLPGYAAHRLHSLKLLGFPHICLYLYV